MSIAFFLPFFSLHIHAYSYAWFTLLGYPIFLLHAPSWYLPVILHLLNCLLFLFSLEIKTPGSKVPYLGSASLTMGSNILGNVMTWVSAHMRRYCDFDWQDASKRFSTTEQSTEIIDEFEDVKLDDDCSDTELVKNEIFYIYRQARKRRSYKVFCPCICLGPQAEHIFFDLQLHERLASACPMSRTYVSVIWVVGPFCGWTVHKYPDWKILSICAWAIFLAVPILYS